MTPDTLESHIRHYIDEQPHGCSEIQFLWQGGEPTLAGIDFFRQAVTLQKRHVKPGVNVFNAIQTNGTLIDAAWAQFFNNENFLVGVSLDGPPELHDIYRKDGQGEPTSKRVLGALELLREFDVAVNTLTVVNQQNAQHPEEVYSFLKQQGSGYIQFIPLVERRKGRISEHSVNPRQLGTFLNAIFDQWVAQQDTGRVFIQQVESVMANLLGQPSALCVHDPYCGRGLVLEQNGDIYSCDHFVDKQHHLGNIQCDTYTSLIESDFQKRFGLRKSDGLPRSCRKCLYLRLCYGGCPKDRIYDKPGRQSGINYLCPGYKLFYKHVLPTLTSLADGLSHGRISRKLS
jgi:uncharacterized protein